MNIASTPVAHLGGGPVSYQKGLLYKLHYVEGWAAIVPFPDSVDCIINLLQYKKGTESQLASTARDSNKYKQYTYKKEEKIYTVESGTVSV